MREPRVREQPHLRRPQALARRHQHLPGLARPRRRGGCAGRRADRRRSSPSRRRAPRSRSARSVSAPAGIGAPVAMRTASPPPTTASGLRPIRALPTIFSSIGDAGDAPAHVGGADGEPVHRGRRELGEVSLGDHVLRDHAAVRLGERELQRRERVDLRQDVPPRILHGEQPADVVVIVDVAALEPWPQSTQWRSAKPARRVSAEPVVARSGPAGSARKSSPMSSRSRANSTVAFR